MTVKFDVKSDTKPTPIKPQVWANIFYIDPVRSAPGDGMIKVGPDEWMDADRFPTEELAEQAGRDAGKCCLACMLQIIFGMVVYLRSERLE